MVTTRHRSANDTDSQECASHNASFAVMSHVFSAAVSARTVAQAKAETVYQVTVNSKDLSSTQSSPESKQQSQVTRCPLTTKTVQYTTDAGLHVSKALIARSRQHSATASTAAERRRPPFAESPERQTRRRQQLFQLQLTAAQRCK